MPSSQSKHHGSDWIGFIFFLTVTLMNLGIAVALFKRNLAIVVLFLPTFLHDALITVAFLLRKPLRRQIDGWKPRAVAYVATFLIPGFAFVSSHWRPTWMRASAPPLFMAGVVVWIVGAYLAAWSLLYLRRSFSIVPQARALITSGPYRLARHPVYAGYVLQYGGVTLAYLTPALWAVFLMWWAVLMVRISYEESVLTAAFPDYHTYKCHVGRLMPRIFIRHQPDAQKTGATGASATASSRAKGTAAGPPSTTLNLLVDGIRDR